MNMKESDTSTS